jgi:hypothetical protein
MTRPWWVLITMGLLRGAAWIFGIILLLFGFAYIVAALNNGEEDVGAAHFMIGIFAMFIGTLLCYGGNKLKRKGEYLPDDKPENKHERSRSGRVVSPI